MLARMSFDDGLGDEPPPFRAPPPVDDRLWRHPSEIGDAPTPEPGWGWDAFAGSVSRSRAGRSPWAVSLLSGVVGALLATGLVTVANRHGGPDRQPVYENVLTSVPGARAGPGSAASLPGLSVVEIADLVRPSITEVKVSGTQGEGSGSGVIFGRDGHVLTNSHVVSGADSVTVVLASGKELQATIVGADQESDVAVLKIAGGPYPIATLGTTANLRLGQTAIAIGYPLGLVGGPSVTTGVISALHREVAGQESSTTDALYDMIQTDAPISPGSSGGALLDTTGAVIGLTTAIAVSTVGAERLGFATPVDEARSIAEQLITTGKAVHVWLGIEGGDIDKNTAAQLSLEGGALVAQVIRDGPANRSGLRARDIVVGIDGRLVTTMGELVVALRSHRPGDQVTLDVVRGRTHQSMRVTLSERPANVG